MTDWPNTNKRAIPLSISVLDVVYGIGAYNSMMPTNFPASTTWVANLAIYIPISIPFPYPVRRMFWANGATISGNADVGIFAEDGTAIVTAGGVAVSGNANSHQYYTLTTPIILPGNFRGYLGWSCDGTTSRAWAASQTAVNGEVKGIVQQSSAYPLPTTTATFAAYAGQGIPYCGITRTPSGF